MMFLNPSARGRSTMNYTYRLEPIRETPFWVRGV